MSGNATLVKMGVCNVSFGGTDLGYTAGGVKVTYSSESVEVKVDQEDAPLTEIISKQSCEVTVPMAEYDLTRLATMLPGATLVTDGTTPTKKRLDLSGSSGVDLQTLAKELIITPIGESANFAVTLHNAIPIPKLEFSFEKDKVRVYEVTFKAMKGTSGFISFGDKTATA